MFKPHEITWLCVACGRTTQQGSVETAYGMCSRAARATFHCCARDYNYAHLRFTPLGLCYMRRTDLCP